MKPEILTALIDHTWPAVSMQVVNGWTIRTGAGGGSRVSAATATKAAKPEEHPLAAGAMHHLGQTPIFMIRAGEDRLDQALDTAGYTIKDPVTYYTAPTHILATQRPAPVTCFEVWPPLSIQSEIWGQGGIDAPRLAIMDRAMDPKTTILGRINDSPAGTLFAALHDGTAMLHAIETAPSQRRQGVAGRMIRAAAFWAQSRDAHTIALLVTRANAGANALYTSMGFTAAGGYHYRIAPEAL